MRDPHTNFAKLSQRRRRAALAIILLATSPTWADGLQSDSVRILPPLPLQPTTDAQHAQSNPFCEPITDVQLASSDASAVKLKPIGTAIGLKPIGDRSAYPAQPPTITIEPVSSPTIQTNPMVGSTHHANHQLVEAEIEDRSKLQLPIKTIPSQEPSDRPGNRASSIVLMPAAPVKCLPAWQPAPPNPPAVDMEPVVSNPVRLSPALPGLVAPGPATPNAVLASPTIQPAATPVPAAQHEPIMAAQPVAQQPAVPKQTFSATADTATRQVPDKPVCFSLSDRLSSHQEPSKDDAEEAIQRVDVPSTEELENSEELENTSELQRTAELESTFESELLAEVAASADDVKPIADVQDVATTAPVSPPLGVVEPFVIGDEAEEMELMPIESALSDQAAPPIAIYRSQPTVTGPVKSANESLHSKRYRPPVAVKPVPIVVVRDAVAEPAGNAGSTVQQVEAPNLDGVLRASSAGKLTPLYMSRAQVRSLTLGGEVRRVKVADESVCQAFAAGPNQLKLIGTGNGVTRLVVWADSDDADAPTRMRAFEVHVKDAVETTGDAIGNHAERLNQSIRTAFPHANVLVRNHRGQLVVAGHCGSEATAKKIMRMVRKTCLVPVKDELAVR